VGGGRIERLDLRGLEREQLTVPIHSTVRGPLEIVIANSDSPPPRVTGVEALEPAVTAVFIARPGETYRLAYGLPVGVTPLPAPRYDTAAIEAALAAGRLPTTVAPGAAAEVAVARPTPAPGAVVRDLTGDPWLLGAVIVALAIAVLVALVQAVRRIENLPPDDDDRPRDGA
jgi:hypothetical protein